MIFATQDLMLTIIMDLTLEDGLLTEGAQKIKTPRV